MRLIAISVGTVFVALAAGVASFIAYVEAVMDPGPPFCGCWDSRWTDDGLIVGSAVALLTASALVVLVVWTARLSRQRDSTVA